MASAGSYCAARDTCDAGPIEDAGRTLLINCPVEITMVSCVPEEEGTCQEGELCVAHNIHTGDDTQEFDGNYCALEEACQTYIVDDYGRDLYVTCPWTTHLVACSDDDICIQ